MLDFHFHDVMSPVSVHVYNSFGLFKSNCCPMMVCPSMPSSDRIHSPVIELNTRIFSSQITNNALKRNQIFFNKWMKLSRFCRWQSLFPSGLRISFVEKQAIPRSFLTVTYSPHGENIGGCLIILPPATFCTFKFSKSL